MKRVIAAFSLILFVACATQKDRDDAPSTVPPADLQSTAQLEAHVAEMQTSMTELLERLDVMNERLNKMEAGASLGGAPAPSPARSAPTSAGEGAGAPLRTTQPSRALASAAVADTYRRALMLYGQSKFDDARRTFQQAFDSEPSGDLADNSLYWIGETYFAAGGYSEAMKYYKRVTTEFSDSNKAPDALFKIALSYEKLSDLGMARTTLEDVIRHYPYSSPAASAKVELKRIKY